MPGQAARGRCGTSNFELRTLNFEGCGTSVSNFKSRICALSVLLLLILLVPALRAGRISPLGTPPDWNTLKAYDGTMTRREFEHLLRTFYAPDEAAWRPFILLTPLGATLVTDSNFPAQTVALRFASPRGRHAPPPRYWHAPSALKTKAQLARPLTGVRIALDPGHLGGPWAKLEERWFQIDGSAPITEGDLTLRVAELVAPRLEALGATVLWVRRTTEPATPLRPEQLLETARAAFADRGVTDVKPTYDGYADPTKEKSVQWEAEKFFYRLGEIRARARLVNDELKPDVTLCLHFNAEEWGDPVRPALVEKNHLHMLVNGNYGPTELRYDDVRYEMLLRLLQRIHEPEVAIGERVGAALQRATRLPAYEYADRRAIRVRPGSIVWARNLLANRLYQSPVVYCEPYVMNSVEGFARLQAGDYDGLREIAGKRQPSIFREYADAVAEGLARYYRGAR